MPRVFFQLHAGQSRTHPVRTGEHLPDPESALDAVERTARQLLAWTSELVPWCDCHVQVQDEADAVRFELLLSGVGDVQLAPS
jgi:hypothetical protein